MRAAGGCCAVEQKVGDPIVSTILIGLKFIAHSCSPRNRHGIRSCKTEQPHKLIKRKVISSSGGHFNKLRTIRGVAGIIAYRNMLVWFVQQIWQSSPNLVCHSRSRGIIQRTGYCDAIRAPSRTAFWVR